LAHADRSARADEVPVAVLGLGQMGRAVAQRLVRNGYHVTGWSLARHRRRHPSFGGRDALGEVLANAGDRRQPAAADSGHDRRCSIVRHSPRCAAARAS
jgi:3-hydroxyacyl-CoA dehydrogenase